METNQQLPSGSKEKIEKMKLLDRKVLTKLYQLTEQKRGEITKDSPLDLELEAICWWLHTLEAKKKYCAWIFEKCGEETLPDGEVVFLFKESVKIRGLESEKRDQNKFTRKVVAQVVELLVQPTPQDREFGFSGFVMFPNHDYVEERRKNMLNRVAIYIHDKLNELAEGQISLDNLAVSKNSKPGGYKVAPAHEIVAKRMRAREQEVEAGAQIEIIKVKTKFRKETENWEEKKEVQFRNLPIDLVYYLETNLIPILERIIVLPGLFTKQYMDKICSSSRQILAGVSIQKYFKEAVTQNFIKI